MNTLNYRPEFNREPRDVSGGYEVPEGTRDMTMDPMKPILDLADTFEETDLIIADINQMIEDQAVSTMHIPVDSSMAPSIADISNGDHDNYISGQDWLRAEAMIGGSFTGDQTLDPMDILWDQLKIRLAEWLGDVVDGIPVIGDELKAALLGSIQEPTNTIDAHRAADGGTPRTLPGILDSTGLLHSDNIMRRIRGSMQTPTRQSFNPTAVELKPVVANLSRNWESTKRVVAGGFGIQVEAETPVNRTNMLEYIRKEGSDIGAPLADGYSIIRNNIITGSFWDIGIIRNRQTLLGIRNALHGYLSGQDLACCLLDNILGLGEVSGNTIKFLRTIRLGLMYTFNGLNLEIDPLVNTLSSLLNTLITVAMSKVMTTLESALSNQLINTRNYLTDYAHTKGEAWVRCYPFDELMGFALDALAGIEEDLLAYVADYTGKLKLGLINTGKLTVRLKKREYVRKSMVLLDGLINGIELGIICKNARDIDVEYTRPTKLEIEAFVQDYTIRAGTNVDEATGKYNMAPYTGNPLDPSVPLSGRDMKWIQNCNLSMTDDELDDIGRALRSITTQR